jgi:hypothetical protein
VQNVHKPKYPFSSFLLIKQAASVFPVAELADTLQFFYVLFIGVRDVIPLVDKGCVINPVKKVFDEVGKTAFIKSKGFFDKFLCLMFIHIYSFKQFVFCI